MKELIFENWYYSDDDKYINVPCKLICYDTGKLYTRYTLQFPAVDEYIDSFTKIYLPSTNVMCSRMGCFSTNIIPEYMKCYGGVFVSIQKPDIEKDRRKMHELGLEGVRVADTLKVTVTDNNFTMFNELRFITYAITRVNNGDECDHMNNNDKIADQLNDRVNASFKENAKKTKNAVPASEVPVITFGKMYDDVIVPSKRPEDAGLDIYAHFDEEYRIIPPHTTKIIPTGLVSHFSERWFIRLCERGSTGTLGIAQRSGIIDSGYRGEWNVPLTNTTGKYIIIAKNMENLDDHGKAQARMCYANILQTSAKNIILYPYHKAICQAIVERNYDVDVKTDTVENVKAVPSQRGAGKFGSSGK